MRNTPNKICESAKPNTTDWKDIENKMYKYKRNVTSLQNRIYRASRKGDEKKVRDLQRQLMNSYSALVLAIDRVTKKNKGRRIHHNSLV